MASIVPDTADTGYINIPGIKISLVYKTASSVAGLTTRNLDVVGGIMFMEAFSFWRFVGQKNNRCFPSNRPGETVTRKSRYRVTDIRGDLLT